MEIIIVSTHKVDRALDELEHVKGIEWCLAPTKPPVDVGSGCHLTRRAWLESM